MKAVIIGATGLVGKKILKDLLGNNAFSEILIFVRRSSGMKHPKLKELIINFDDPKDYLSQVSGDVFFSALGTTLKSAGSKEAQYLVDFHYQLNFAQAAKANGVRKFILISSTGANPRSKIFYLRMKGELEESLSQIGFEALSILRPGPLQGERENPRVSEILSTGLLNLLPKSRAFATFLPVDAETVASKAVQVSQDKNLGKRIFEAKDILFIG